MAIFVPTIDSGLADQWILTDLRTRRGEPVDSLLTFERGRTYRGSSDLVYPEPAGGKPAGWMWAEIMTPVVTTAVAELLWSVAPRDFQRVPVRIGARTDAFEIVNITSVVDCIDLSRAKVREATSYAPGEQRRFITVEPLALDERRLAGANLFRVMHYLPCIGATSLIHDAMIKAGVRGVHFLVL